VAGERAETDRESRPGEGSVFLRLGLGLVVVGLALAGVFRAAEWYADRVSMARYCDDPDGAAALAARVLTDPRPAGAEPTRRHVVAAKLLFLVPQRHGEDTQAYAARLRGRIEATCQGRFGADPSA
jgi:hypothetical protein